MLQSLIRYRLQPTVLCPGSFTSSHNLSYYDWHLTQKLELAAAATINLRSQNDTVYLNYFAKRHGAGVQNVFEVILGAAGEPIGR